MKKHFLIELLLVLVILGVSFWNVKQQQETVALRESTTSLKEQRNEYREKEEELLYENERLAGEASASSEALKKLQQKHANSGANVDLNSEYIQVVTKVYEANLNFNPKNYADRKKEVSLYLSNELNKEYFGQGRNTYQDSNGTTSQLESIEVYPKGLQSGELEGLAVVYHKSKKSSQDWNKGMNIFKVAYDSDLKKITKIVNLGSGYAGDKTK